MLLSQNPRSLLSLLTILLSPIHQASATPVHRDLVDTLEGNALLVGRADSCANPCGWGDKYCCPGPGQCYTDGAGQAQCAATAGGAGNFAIAQATAGGYVAYYTTTWVETDFVTHTSTYSSFIPYATIYTTTATITAQAAAPSCNPAMYETACGSICCSAGYFCGANLQCISSGGGSSIYYNTIYNSYSPPLRPTTAGATVTVGGAIPFQTPVPTGSTVLGAGAAAPSNNGLSGGAIAGIVIGVLLGIILLLLICFYCCLRAGLDGLLALFGLKPRGRRTSETIIEEHHHGSGGAAGWFGRRPTRVDVIETRPPKKSGLGLGGIAAGLAGLAVLLGLKRRHDRYDDKSDTYTSYSSTYTSTSSASSSDRRTRESRSHGSRSHR